MKKKGRISIAILMCVTMICSTLFSSAAVFAGTGGDDTSDQIKDYMDASSVTINTSTGQYKPGESLDPKGSFEFKLAFSEDANGKQFPKGGKMYYDVPKEIEVTEEITDASILEEGSEDKVIGTYSISKTGKISVDLDDEYIEKYDNVKVKMSFKGSFEKSFTEQGDDNYIEFADGVKVEVNFKKVVTLDIKKSHELQKDKKTANFDYEKNQITYNVEVTADNDTTGVVVTDVPSATLAFIPKTLTVYDNNAKKAVETKNYTVNKDAADGWEIQFPSMEKGASYTISYAAKLSESAIAALNNNTDVKAEKITVNNTASIKSDDFKGKSTNDNYTIASFGRLRKDVKVNQAKDQLTWTVTVNEKKFYDVSGCTVIDTLPTGLTLQGNVIVKKDGTKVGEAQKTADGWKYEIPKTPADNHSVYTFTYTTNLPANTTANDIKYSNKVMLKWSDKTMVVWKDYTAGKGVGTDVDKYLAGNDAYRDNGVGYNQAIEMDQAGNRYIHYGVWVDVPAGGIPNAVLEDVVDKDTSGNKGLSHKLYNGLTVTTKEQLVKLNAKEYKDIPVEERFKYITVKNYEPEKMIVEQTDDQGFKIYFGSKDNSKLENNSTKDKRRIYLQYYTKVTGNQSKQAWNFIYLRLSGNDNVNDWENTDIKRTLGLSKTGTYDQKTGLITWVVNIDTGDKQAGLGYDPVTVEDIFSDNQSYVEGSAKLNDKPLDSKAVTGTGNKRTFNLGVCSEKKTHTLTYQTIVNDDVFNDSESVVFKNTAYVNTKEWGKLKVEKELPIDNPAVTKKLVQTPNQKNKYIAKYELTVNPNRATFVGKDSPYEIEDTYSKHLRIDTDSVKIYKDDSTAPLAKGMGFYSLSGGSGGDPLKITIPNADGHKFVITYEAVAFGNVGDKDVPIENTAKFRAGTKQSSTTETGKVTFLAQDSSASGIGSKSYFQVKKCDYADTDRGLANAVFEVYKDKVTSANYLGEAATGTDGIAVFDKTNLNFNGKPYNPVSGVKYILVEKTAPTGYEKGANVEFQLLGDEKQLDDVQPYQVGGIIQVSNQKYNFYINKVAAETGMALTGAEFSLYNNIACKGEPLLTVKEDQDKAGHFTFKGLTRGTYYMKETKVPSKYYDSDKVYTVVIDANGDATMTIGDEPVNKDDKTFTIANSLKGSIEVTKEVKEDGIGKAETKSYYAALFGDSDLKNRVSDVETLELKGTKSTSVTFKDLKVGETYYVAETDKEGNAYPNEENAIGSVISYENQKVSLDPSNLKAESKITNSYYTGGYWSGSINVTKHVTMGGDKVETDKVFYVGLYKDEKFQDRVGKIQELDMGGKASTTVIFSKLAINNTYYVAETDKDGNVITDAEGQLGCEMTIENNKISLTKEKTEGTAEITNAFPNQYNFYIQKTSAHTGEALTGAEFTLFKDKDCKNEVVKATGDKDGKFAFKNLRKGTYYLKETKVPDGYYDAQKVYEVEIDKDGIATIDGEAVKTADKTYTITNTLTGSIKVTKEAKEDGLDTDVYKMTYYAALFSDKELTNCVSDVKALEMDGIHSTSVTFDGLEVGKTYYVAETDQDGKALPRQNDEGKWLVDYENQVVKLDPSNLNAESKITNSYFSDYYWSGSIDVTKLVTKGGDKAETNKVFYVGLYNDKDFTDRVGEIQELKMEGKASTTVTFSDLPLNHTYYVAETDKDGSVITNEKAAQQGYKIDIENQKVSLTKENQIGAAKITNAFDDEYNFYIQKTSAHTGDALTGAEFTLFKDSSCTDKKVTVKGDDNGKFAFKNLNEGTYFLKETKVPDGYHDSEKVYTVAIGADGNATIDGDAVNAEDKTYTVANTLAGKIKVTKAVKDAGIDTEDFGTYYTALFSDSDFQNRVTEVKALDMNGKQSTSVTFDNLKVNETYYVAETDADGKAFPNKGNPIDATITYDNQVVTLDPNNLSAESKITNNYNADFYWAGSIDVTKRVTVGGKAAETNNIFYAGLYTDKACTEQVGDIQPLVMDGNAETTVTFSDLSLGHTYYVAETDSKGKVITDSKEQLGCEMTIDNNKISLTKENQTGAAEIVNDFPDEEQFYYDGEITVKKTTTYNGKAYDTDDVFYVALFADKAHTKRITDVKALDMDGGSKAKVSFENLAYGAYYLAETDKDGKALSDIEAAKLGYTNLVDEVIQLDENPVDIELENQMTQEYVKAVQTGDESNLALAMLGMLAALTAMAILVISRKRKNS